jgi:hypothetical protein
MKTGNRIVIADDNAEIRELLTETFKDLGYEIDTVSDGYELISYLEKNFPSLIILDMMMPEKSGAAIFDTLKQMSPYSRIIIYTGRSDYEKSVYARNADRFLVKGGNITELIEAVKELA